MKLCVESVTVTRTTVAVRWCATRVPRRDVTELLKDSEGVDCFSVAGTLFPDSCAALRHERGVVRIEWEPEEYGAWSELRDVLLSHGVYNLRQIAHALMATGRAPAKRLALALLATRRARRPPPPRLEPAREARKPQWAARGTPVQARTALVRRRLAHLAGQFGVFARRAIPAGVELVFDAADYAVSDVTRVRLSANAFDHPYSKRKAIDSVRGSLLQAVNSTWDGRAHTRPQNVQHWYVGGRMSARTVADIAAGQELLFSYEW